jgi:hypothetical protein
MRQPKIYIRLPSNGDYWPEGSIEMPDNLELPVYSMTARDELLFKTPDALMNGQAIVDVIHSCMPNIKNAWECPTIDLDTILISIRLATYGELMPFKFKVPNIQEEIDYEIDLRVLLDQQSMNIWEDVVVINDELMIHVKPLTYKHLTQTNLKSFETNKILNMVNDDSISEERKLEIFNDSFGKLTRVTVDLLVDSIYKIVIPTGEVTDRAFISEFVNNTDKEIFKQVQDHLKRLKDQNDMKPLQVNSTPEQIEQGAPESYTIPITFNNSDFFAQGF